MSRVQRLRVAALAFHTARRAGGHVTCPECGADPTMAASVCVRTVDDTNTWEQFAMAQRTQMVLTITPLPTVVVELIASYSACPTDHGMQCPAQPSDSDCRGIIEMTAAALRRSMDACPWCGGIHLDRQCRTRTSLTRMGHHPHIGLTGRQHTSMATGSSIGTF